MQMRDGQHNNLVGIVTVQDGIGKSVKQTAANSKFEHGSASRMLNKLRYCGFHLVKKSRPQSFDLQIVVGCRIEHFLLG